MACARIGNPPFLGGKLLITNLGEDYVSRMFATYAGRVPAEADLVWLLVREGGPADRLRQNEPGRARRDELHPWRREPAGAAGGDRHAADPGEGEVWAALATNLARPFG